MCICTEILFTLYLNMYFKYLKKKKKNLNNKLKIYRSAFSILCSALTHRVRTLQFRVLQINHSAEQ